MADKDFINNAMSLEAQDNPDFKLERCKRCKHQPHIDRYIDDNGNFAFCIYCLCPDSCAPIRATDKRAAITFWNTAQRRKK